MPASDLTPAQRYHDKVWESTLLTAEQRITALCYANHAKRSDVAWVALTRLMQQTGIRSRTTATKAVRDLVDAGWLVRLGEAPGHRQRVLYRLVVPDREADPDVKPTRSRGAGGRFAQAVTGPADGPVQQVDRSRTWTETGPGHGPRPVQDMDHNRSMLWTEPVQHVDSTLYDSPKDSLTDSPKDSPPAGVAIGSDDDPAFVAFWDAYPRKVGKPSGRKAWRAAIKRKADPTAIVAAAQRYRDDPLRRSRQIEYTPHPATWLNDERYNDAPVTRLPSAADHAQHGRGPARPGDIDWDAAMRRAQIREGTA